MRATYEDMLRTARRMAVNVERGTHTDAATMMSDGASR